MKAIERCEMCVRGRDHTKPDYIHETKVLENQDLRGTGTGTEGQAILPSIYVDEGWVCTR